MPERLGLGCRGRPNKSQQGRTAKKGLPQLMSSPFLIFELEVNFQLDVVILKEEFSGCFLTKRGEQVAHG